MKKSLSAADESYNCRKPDISSKLFAILGIVICLLFLFLFFTSHAFAAYEYDSSDYLTTANEDFSISYLDSEISNPLPFSGKLLILPIYVFRTKLNEEEKRIEKEKVSELLVDQLVKADMVYQQIGITVDTLPMYSVPEIYVDGFPEGQFFFDKNNVGREDKIVEHLNRYVFPLTVDAVPVFFIPSLGSPDLLGKTMNKWMIDERVKGSEGEIVIAQPGCFIAFNSKFYEDTLAHELGHFLLNDRFFYPSMCIPDGSKHHLPGNDYLMSLGDRTSIIDFHPMLRKDHGSPKEMRASRMNQVEVMYNRSGYVTDKIAVDPNEIDILQIYMPNFFTNRDREEQVIISPRDGSKAPFSFYMPYFINLTWGGDRHTEITLSEYWKTPKVVDKVTNIQVSSWARVVPTSGKIEYCIDIYFDEPFSYFPYTNDQKMVPDAYSNNEMKPYFALIMSKFADSFIESPQVHVFKYTLNENYPGTNNPEEIEPEDIETEQEIYHIPSEDGPFFNDIFWIKLDLEDMRDVTHLRWTWQ